MPTLKRLKELSGGCRITLLAFLTSARRHSQIAATNFVWRNRGVSGQLVISAAMKSSRWRGRQRQHARRVLSPRTYDGNPLRAIISICSQKRSSSPSVVYTLGVIRMP